MWFVAFANLVNFQNSPNLQNRENLENRQNRENRENRANPTYSHDIAPLIADRCIVCHHEEGSAPFSLETYATVKRHASQIVQVTRKRVMPPWKADPADGPFVGQHPLSDEEISRIAAWVEAGTPEGTAEPPARSSSTHADRWAPGWQLGKPDLVVTLPEPYALQASGTDVFRIFVLPLPVDRTRYVRGLEFHPGNVKVVHHANIRIDHTPASRALDSADPGPGYSGLILRSADYPEGHFLGWTPGQVPPLLPKEMTWRLDPGTDLVVEVHMQPSGKTESVQPTIGLYFSDTPPTKTPAMLRLGRQNIDIPAGESHYVVTDSYVLPVDAEIEAVQPHAHYRARDVRGDATLPDGTTRELIHIGDWDFRWQHVFRFEHPFWLPKGTRLSMRYVYDNSVTNVRNPEHPPVRARWGQRSSDEMGDLWIQVLTRTEPDLVTLTREFRAKVAAEDVHGYESEIARDPNDAALHDDAALLYLELQQPNEAVEHFRKSMAIKGASAAGHYNVATALALAHRLDESAKEYEAAIAIDRSYAKAHNNLGNVRLAQGRTVDAIAEFAVVAKLEPRSADPLENLAQAYAIAGDFDRAADTIDRALRLSPPEPLASELARRRELYRQRKRP
ncbi:MAG TPA: tetratricopeptide repeat protein [Vicinamibacterales bacterium]|nr:tetratricopeptide repeat protein [Vicinamibacterales bacterium]